MGTCHTLRTPPRLAPFSPATLSALEVKNRLMGSSKLKRVLQGVLNWVPAALAVAMIAAESTATMSADNTSRWLFPVWIHIFGPISAARWAEVHHLIRKTGHFIGYGLVDLAFFHGWRTSLEAEGGMRRLWYRAARAGPDVHAAGVERGRVPSNLSARPHGHAGRCWPRPVRSHCRTALLLALLRRSTAAAAVKICASPRPELAILHLRHNIAF